MPVGKPSITAPARLELTLLQQTVNNIRERIQALEAAYGITEAATNQGLLTANKRDLSTTNTLRRILARLDELEAERADRFLAVLNADENIARGAPVYVSSDGAVSMIDPDNASQCWAFLGVATEAASGGNAVTIGLPGAVVNIPGSTFTAGRPLYASAGGVTHDPAGNALPVGFAIDSDTMSVGYGFNVLGEEVFDASERDSMAVTYGLGGSGGGVLPLVTGEVPPVLVYLDDGSLVYSGV